MGELTEQDVERIVDRHAVTRRLSSGQKWDVAVIVGLTLGGIFAILGAGVGTAAFFAIKSTATNTADQAARAVASKVSVEHAAAHLVSSADLRAKIAAELSPLPSGAVVSFANAASPERPSGCPAGWRTYANAAGRVIIGVGQGANLALRKFEDVGGEEEHTLTVEEMPTHRHWRFFDAEGRIVEPPPANPQLFLTDPKGQGWNKGRFRVVTKDEPGVPEGHLYDGARETERGGGQPHNNMPPYIVLYFCKKD